ncbi:outer membrane beta-barrel protein [Polaribacter uvawellassae]|uniref:outer membrane beta-barrel protein n=1 Tax=Polaribacter uvawellassae TaxID=3133495 RepID=UPI0032190609
MKRKKIALLILLFTAISSFSQIEKGKVYIGASSSFSASFTTNSNENDNYSKDIANLNSFSFSPKLGYTITDNLVVGVDFILRYSNVSFKDSSSENINSTYVIGPFIKYYLSKKVFKPFLLAEYGFGSQYSKFESSTSKSETEEEITILILGGGISYFINDTIGLELGVNYTKSMFKSKISNPSNNKSINSGIGTFIGFVLVF